MQVINKNLGTMITRCVKMNESQALTYTFPHYKRTGKHLSQTEDGIWCSYIIDTIVIARVAD